MPSPLFSVIIPAYNSEKYIRQAINSVLQQTLDDIEVVVVDDCSTDSTADIVRGCQYNDARLVYHKLENNTGSAYIPREVAVKMAKSEYIVLLDSDDYLEVDYLKKAFGKIESTNADTILGKMYILSNNGDFDGTTIPNSDFDESQVLSGVEALKLTVPWRIGLNGAVFKKKVFLQSLEDNDNNDKGVYGDELFCRRCLLNSNKVVFSGAKYFYQTNPDSLVHTFSPRIFHMLDTYEEVREFFISQFGRGGVEHQNAERYMFSGLEYCFSQYLRGENTLTKSQKKEYLEKFREWYYKIDFNLIYPKSKQEHLYALGFTAYNYIRSINFIIRKWYHSLRK